MARYFPITDPTAEVNVSATVTQKAREELRTLAFAKEHCSVKKLLATLVQRYLDDNADFLKTLAGFREEPVTSEPEVATVN